ncbi:MAG: hypothetical protein KZQ97_17860 [Candidatus Thiodiazotropha sp. (ex Dulcina madagascariensis)]|nr:hypothetical protein [Candidatus Thiodiazotropha sp. (ex Dulcina madagascariensis)]
MATARKSKGNSLKINLELQALDEKQSWPEISAYLYNKSGRLLAKSAVKQEPRKPGMGSALFEGLESGDEKGLTVKIGPNTESVREIARQKLSTHRLDSLPRLADIPTVMLPHPVWICWIKVPYLVTGTVDKWADGKKYPVCVGEVDIYDVDVYCLLKIPDIVIERIRDGIIDLVLDPPPFDIRQPEKLPQWCDIDDDDWCGTPPRPRPPFVEDLQAKLAKLPLAWSFATKRVAAMDTARSRLDENLAAMPVNEKQLWLNSTISGDVQLSKVLYSNTQQFRTLLVEQFQTFRFWLCWYPWIHWLWWPWCRFYGLEKLGTAQLQSDGSFSTLVPLSICRKDQPDLWFKVRQSIEGIDRVIYARYPVLCHTYWNHPSGKSVSLLTHDAQTVVCDPNNDTDKPGIYVMPLGIGDDGWYQIEQAHLKLGDIPNTDRGLYNATDPYGTRLDVRMQFHDSLTSKGVAHYRWSVAPEGTSSWSYLNAPITHRYLDQIGSNFFIVPEELGPFVVGVEPSLFKVPDPAKDWIALNRNDRAFALWYTALWDGDQNRYVAQVTDGRYVLRLEMFDAAGNRLDPTAPGADWNFFLPTSDVVGGVWPVDDNPHVQPDGSVHFNLWVDNTDTTADIQSVGLGGSATGECQFIEYNDGSTDQVRVTYVAYHKLPPERDFLASYSLSIKRGISGTTVESDSSTTPAHTPTNLDAGVDHLLRQIGSKGPYTRCAFAVELHTNPRTRNGFSRIRQYESHDTSAFALMKKPIPCPPFRVLSSSAEPAMDTSLVKERTE